METNPYIYPFKPFADLSSKGLADNLGPRRVIGPKDLQALAGSVPAHAPRIEGSTVEERILSVFMDPNYLLGPREYVTDLAPHWISRLRRFTSRDEPLQLVIMACPFKIPVPLKTDRRTADLAEGLQILQLRAVCRWIKSVYAPGAHVTILAEGILGLCMGVSPEVRKLYQESLTRLLLALGAPDEVGIHSLDDITDVIPGFEHLWRDEVERLKELERLGDEAFRSEYDRTFQSVYRMVNSEGYALEDLMDAYNESLPDRLLSAAALQSRRRLKEMAREAVFGYRAFLRARDRSGYLERIAPGNIKLTVSAKPGNLGVLPVNAQTHVLPHHGVAVHDPARGHFTVEYLIDLRRSRHCFRQVYLEGDLEVKPFYYEVMELNPWKST